MTDMDQLALQAVQEALNESDGSTEGRAPGVTDHPVKTTYSVCDVAPAGIKPCPSEPFDPVEMELAFLKRDMDALVANLSNPATAARYAGHEAMLFSIQLSTDLTRSAAKADWPARARHLKVVK